ncbi:MAG: 50S ribosomal protein L4, partial [Rhodospirillales bacterium]|nr:50S ribosomal protein L4 [Rhodospirillales bacterium]
KLVILDAAKAKTPKTGDLAKQVEKLGWGRALVIDGPELDENFSRAASNIIGLDLLPQQGANVYDILNSDLLVLTKDAVEKLVERLK